MGVPLDIPITGATVRQRAAADCPRGTYTLAADRSTDLAPRSLRSDSWEGGTDPAMDGVVVQLAYRFSGFLRVQLSREGPSLRVAEPSDRLLESDEPLLTDLGDDRRRPSVKVLGPKIVAQSSTVTGLESARGDELVDASDRREAVVHQCRSLREMAVERSDAERNEEPYDIDPGEDGGGVPQRFDERLCEIGSFRE